MQSWRGLTVQLAYTYLHEIDEVSFDLNSLSKRFSPRYDRGSGALDRRHDFNANYIYNLPLCTHSNNAFVRTAAKGCSISGVTVAETGLPQPLNYNGTDTLGLGGGTRNRPNQVKPVTYPKTRLAWFDETAFANPIAPWNGGPNQGFGNSGKDAFRLPVLFHFNLAIFKEIAFGPTDHASAAIENIQHLQSQTSTGRGLESWNTCRVYARTCLQKSLPLSARTQQGSGGLICTHL